MKGKMRLRISTFLFMQYIFGVTVDAVRRPEIVHDTVLPMKRNDQHGEVIMSTALPDWNDAKLDGHERFIETVLVIEPELMRFYENDETRLRKGLVSMMHGVNLFLYQLDIRIVVVDVITDVRHYQMTLDDFATWREHHIDQMVPHDIAVLIKLRYEGGIAYVGGVCGRSAVGISGFFPESPFEYAGVFVHELAHLLGLSHDSGAQCSCTDWQNCLRIDGFERDCAVQALANNLHKYECIQDPPTSLSHAHLSICGNGLHERDEQCDCGPRRFCWNPLCEPTSCQLRVPLRTLYILAALLTLVTIFVFFCAIRSCSSRTRSVSTLVSLSTDSTSPSLSKSTSLSSTPDFLEEKRERHFQFPLLDSLNTHSRLRLDDALPVPIMPFQMNEGYVKMYPPTGENATLSRPVKAPPPPPPPPRPVFTGHMVNAPAAASSPVKAITPTVLPPVPDAKPAVSSSAMLPLPQQGPVKVLPTLPRKIVPPDSSFVERIEAGLRKDKESSQESGTLSRPTRSAPPPPMKPKPKLDDNQPIYDVPAV